MVLCVAIIANLVVTFPIIINIVNRAAEAGMGVEYSPWIRILVVGIAVLIGRFLPYFFPFLTLVGALIGIPISMFFPVGIYWALAKHECIKPSDDPGAVIKHVLICIFGLLAVVFGT